MKRNVALSTIMTPAPYAANLTQKLSEVRDVITRRGFHHVPVVDAGKLVGLLSASDILRVSYTYGQDPRGAMAVLDHTLSIADVMTTDVRTLAPTDTIRAAFEELAEGGFHALPIVDADRTLVGILTTTDLLRYALAQY